MWRLSCLAAVLITLGLAGCAEADLQGYYTPETARTFPHTETVALIDGGSDAEKVYQARYENHGYVRIGRISFVGRYAEDSPLRAFGRQVGADVVVVSRRYIDTHVIDNPRGPVGQYNGMPRTNEYGAEEPQFNPAFMPGAQESEAADSYVTREYRQVAIFLRHGPG